MHDKKIEQVNKSKADRERQPAGLDTLAPSLYDLIICILNKSQ